VELSRSWEPASRSTTQEFLNILWNARVHYRVHKSPPLVPIQRQINPVHTDPSHLSNIHFIIIFPPSGPFPSGFPTKILYPFLLFQACYMPCPSNIYWFGYSNCSWRRVKVMKLVIMQLSPPSRPFIPIQSSFLMMGLRNASSQTVFSDMFLYTFKQPWVLELSELRSS
jgi:hypothetical protein